MRQLAVLTLAILLVGSIAQPAMPANQDRDARIAELKLKVRQDRLNSELAVACYYGNIEDVERLIAEGADVNATGYPNRLVTIGHTPLTAAVFGGQSEVVSLLIERGADPEFFDDYRTPLGLAATWGKNGPARVLLEHGVNPNQLDPLYQDVKMNPAATVATMVAFNGAYPATIFKDAVGGGHREVVELMIEHGGYYIAPDSYIDAVIRGDADRLREELSQGDPRLEGGIGMWAWKPVQLAAMLNRAETIRVLAEKGAKLEYDDEDDGDPLLLAANCGNLEAVQALIELGVEINPPDSSRDDLIQKATSPRTYSVDFLRNRPRRVNDERLELVRYLLEDVVTAAPLENITLESAVRMNAPETLRLLIEAGADVNAEDEYGSVPLSSASGSPETARVLLECGADPNLAMIRGMPILNWSAKSPYADVTELLLEYGADLSAVDENGATALHRAALEGASANVRLLLEHGAEVDALDEQGLTPCDYAVWGNADSWDPLIDEQETLRLLIEAGADIHHENGKWSSATHNAAMWASPELVSILLEAGGDPLAADDLGNTPLHYACEGGHAGNARVLLDAGADPMAKNNDGKTPWELIPSEIPESRSGELEILLLRRMAEEAELMAEVRQEKLDEDLNAAADLGDIDRVIELLDQGADIDSRHQYLPGLITLGRTPLEKAVYMGHVELVRLLIERDARIDNDEPDYSSPLRLAAEYGQPEITRLLIEAGADPNETLPVSYRISETIDGILYRHSSLMELLTLMYESVPDFEMPTARDMQISLFSEMLGWAFAHNVMKSAAEHGHTEVVDILAAEGAYYAAPGSFIDAVVKGDAARVRGLLNNNDYPLEQTFWNSGKTPMMLAAALGRTDVVRVLAEAGARIEPEDGDGGSPLTCAVRNGHLETVRLLLELGATLDESDDSAYLICEAIDPLPEHFTPKYMPRPVTDHGVDMLRLLLDNGADAAPEDNRPLMRAAINNNLEAIRMLVAAGADVNQGDEYGAPLHRAPFEAARLLLGLSADVHAVDDEGNSVLRTAAGRSDSRLIELLIEHGAELERPGRYKMTPLHSAAYRYKVDNVKTLIEAGADVDAQDEWGLTPLDRAVSGVYKKYDPFADQARCVKLLLEAGADPHLTGEEGWTLLHTAAHVSPAEVVRLLVEAGLDVNAADDSGDTPLHVACRWNEAENACLLLELGADPTLKNNDGQAPWDLVRPELNTTPEDRLELLILSELEEKYASP